jgi:hypothetical protein
MAMLLSLAAVLGGPLVGRAVGEVLVGVTESSAKWGVGWIELNKDTDFKKGEKLRLKVGGTATKILVRLLSDLSQDDDPVGIEGGVHDVPQDRVVEVVLSADYFGVKEISVHGNPEAWSWSLGKDNGPATLESVERVQR